MTSIQGLPKQKTASSGWCLSLLLGCTVLLAGCAGMGTPKTPEQRVAERAQSRADALIAGDFEKSFRYTTPAFQQGFGLNNYTRRYAGASRWNKAEVADVSCSGDRCEVSLRITYRTFRGGFENTRSMDERWIEVDGNWYLFLK